MKRLYILLLAIVCAVTGLMAVDNALADSAYSREQYGEAVRIYQAILDSAGGNADIYYNLGNAHYRHGDVAHAVLNYERALRLDPSHSDARANLQFVNARLQDKPEENNSFLSRLHMSVVTAASANAWAWLALLSFVLLCGAIALYIFSSDIKLRKVGFFGGMMLVVVTVYLIVVAADAASRVTDHSEAIVTAPSTMLNSVPRQPRPTEKVLPLHEGTKVRILDSISTPDDPVSPRYYKITINGSAPAWLRATDVERI